MKSRSLAGRMLALITAAVLFTGCAAQGNSPGTADQKPAGRVSLRVGSLKGPTTIGLLHLMEETAQEEAAGAFSYEFSMETDPSVLAAGIVSGDLDIALVPANLAAVLYRRTEGGVVCLNINTFGVLECVAADEAVMHVTDLSGKTVLSTGQGATPEYALRFLLDRYQVGDCDTEFHSEAQEIAALLKEHPERIAILPEPFATVAVKQNEALSIRFSLAEEWDALGLDSSLVTGVTVIRREVMETIGAEGVTAFLEDHARSMALAKYGDPDKTALLVTAAEIIGSEGIAKAALPRCGIAMELPGEDVSDALSGACTGSGMKTLLSGYLQTLYDADPQSVGGSLPDDGFYYTE